MNSLFKVSYALQRQQRAVERTLYASSAEESALASKWVGAWHRLVQARLDRMAESERAGGHAPQPAQRHAGIELDREAGREMGRDTGREHIRYVDSRGRLLH
ncbi:hypothetical protein [Pseudoduganella flava]|nr:hypothetical protein [Pseudoduganella flava]QGZ37968.1 hypothetical protein GO485_02170 [Pseudoduganella flava]